MIFNLFKFLTRKPWVIIRSLRQSVKLAKKTIFILLYRPRTVRKEMNTSERKIAYHLHETHDPSKSRTALASTDYDT